MIKNYFRILKKTYANLQTIFKTPVKFQKDRTKTVGGVKGTKYLLKTRNHAPRTTHHVPRTTPTENQKQCPSTFHRKGGGQKKRGGCSTSAYKADAAVHLGPVVQSVVSLMSSLRVISLTVLADSIHNILIFFVEKNVNSFCTAKATHIFSTKNFSKFAYHSM